ncbi:MAG TPA: hypothetical protein VNZ53_34370 [Steroidobacteraceae bacterium]|jgi:hypothetical protein|nr:hypothetical protein [Steroidobacteraceae bacterium]
MGDTPTGNDARVDLIAVADRLYGDDLSRKPLTYLVEYDRIFQSFQDKPIRLLELGVQNGLSILMWQEYFQGRAEVVGIDVSPKPATFPEDPRFSFLQGGQDDPVVIAAACDGRPFDVIIDDASHLGFLTARSFALLFPTLLNPGGVYVIEDICTAFTSSGADFDCTDYCPAEIGLPGSPRIFPSHHHGMVGFVKQLIDHAMGPTAAGGYTRYAIESMLIKTNIAYIRKAL